ncbi:MAG: HEAT repeat domain-containing protein [Planctomyces sp.]|nr:HEAT repeat domain-containing protein [Planctomyces sp.]
MRMPCLGWLILSAVMGIGCQSKSDSDSSTASSSSTSSDTVETGTSTGDVTKMAQTAEQLRAAMTAPEIMKLDSDGMADSTLRGLRQREAGDSFMRQLISNGKAADSEIWKLMNDEDESVRRSVTILLEKGRVDAAGKPLEIQMILDLHIPLFERALESDDEQVRYFACNALGNFSTWSDGCLERLTETLPKLRELKDDPDKDVRGVAWAASNFITSELSRKAATPEARASAVKALEQLNQENRWDSGNSDPEPAK